MGLFNRKKTTDLAKDYEQQAYAEERLRQAEQYGKQRARDEYKAKKSGGGGFLGGLKDMATRAAPKAARAPRRAVRYVAIKPRGKVRYVRAAPKRRAKRKPRTNSSWGLDMNNPLDWI